MSSRWQHCCQYASKLTVNGSGRCRVPPINVLFEWCELSHHTVTVALWVTQAACFTGCYVTEHNEDVSKKKMMKRQRPLPFCSKTTLGWSLASCSKTMFTSCRCDRTIRLHTAYVVMWHNARRFLTASSCYDEPHQSVPAFQPLHHAHILLVCVFFFQVRLLFAPPGLAGLEDDNSLSAVRLLFLFSASFPPPPGAPPSVPPPFSLSRSRSLSRVLLVFSDIFTEELLPEETDRKIRQERNVSWTPQTSGSQFSHTLHT